MSSRAQSLPKTVDLNGESVVGHLLEWFDRNGRSFPWRSIDDAAPSRGHLHDPYSILVSEVMLQQTQAERVADRLVEFLEQFPTLQSLASASRGTLLRAWSGLGYNRRALNLQRAAQAVLEQHGGRFPADIELLRELPGVGEYTAAAIACFAFGADVPVVDVNVERVLSRVFFRCPTERHRAPGNLVRRVAGRLVPPGDAYRWHGALMDLGATVCTARRPSCDDCPLVGVCLSAHPVAIQTFDPRGRRIPEPTIRREPRRLWRGRIVEALRVSRGPLRLAALIDALLPDASPAERSEFVLLARTLSQEGMLIRSGVVAEGEITEESELRLPD